jgi:NAD-dependent deacetylase
MNLVILSGAGISAESGIQTFRGNGGLWEGEDVTAVATPEAWHKDPKRVLRFYNERRAGVLSAQPNAGHFALVALEEKYKVSIVTQNVDDLHERAGSTHILHLHGEILKARSTGNPAYVIDWRKPDLLLGDTCPKGFQLRPHIVWFCEAVEAMPEAEDIVSQADILIITGTSLQVYPAAGLVQYAPMHCRLYIVDPNAPKISPQGRSIEIIQSTAASGLPLLVKRLMQS